MEDTTNTQSEQADRTHTTETPGTEAPTSDEQADRDELKETSQQFVRTLLRAGVHMAMTPVNMLPEESREHFESAGRELTRGLATLAHELADTFDTIVEKMQTDVKQDE